MVFVVLQSDVQYLVMVVRKFGQSLVFKRLAGDERTYRGKYKRVEERSA